MQKIKQLVINLFKKYPIIFNPVWEKIIFPFLNYKDINKGIAAESKVVFKDIYKQNYWKGKQSVSGPGSDLEYTTILRKELPILIKKFHIQSILDAPCGDCFWISKINFNQPITYIGCDIAENIINNLYKNNPFNDNVQASFQNLDIVNDPIPNADIWICRDTLFHLPLIDALAVIDKFKKSSINYFLSTSFSFPKENVDVGNGGFRPLNLSISPFNMPKPIYTICDFIAPYPPRYLYLWHKNQF